MSATTKTAFSLSRVVAITMASLFVGVATSSTSQATTCVVPDNGSGTATLPPAAPSANCTAGYKSPTDVFKIINGLPLGTTIEIDAENTGFLCAAGGVCSFVVNPGVDCDESGGSLGGEKECADSTLRSTLTGTGTLVGYSRILNIALSLETHAAPRTPGQPVQSFDTDMFRLFGQITGDPDFDLLRITAGTDFAMPSPGHTILTQATGGWSVDSFFDITYRIDFVGAPSGPLAGMSGSTTGTIRIQIGETAVYDHLECFKAKDPQKLKGVVSLPALAGTPYDAAGCKIGPANKYCTPARKIVVGSSVPVTTMPGPHLTSDYVCYRVKCPKVKLTQGIADQFGARTLGKMKQGELCVPAVKTP